MRSRHIAIVTPAPPRSLAGNRQTALRWTRFLEALGMRVDVLTEWRDGPHELLIALHAKKSRPSLLAFRARHPQRPCVLALTGTDLYRDIRNDTEAAASLELADRLIVLQAAALAELAPPRRAKARVIHQSETARGSWKPPARFARFCVLGHLRDEKDPLRAAEALRLLPDLPQLRVVLAGQPLTPDWAERAHAAAQADERLDWRGPLPHWQALGLLRRSHALIVSSLMEGGAHVVSEAIVHGVPVLASDIAGNRGLLGDDYAGYFPVGDGAALAASMRAAATDRCFLGRLHAALIARQPLFEPAREQAAWRALLAELFPD